MSNNPIQLEVFEGPLDLLLSLISQHEIDIYDIPIAEITSQYMDYIYTMNELNIELASEFIVMAAQLIYIKSKILLPIEEDIMEEEIDPREELIKRLVEYKIYKQISRYIKDHEQSYANILTKEPDYFPELKNDLSEIEIEAQLLASAMRNLLINHKIRIENLPESYEIETESVSIEDRMIYISELLLSMKTINFSEIFDKHPTKPNIIASFLAVLELLKRNIVCLHQDNIYGEIRIQNIGV